MRTGTLKHINTDASELDTGVMAGNPQFAGRVERRVSLVGTRSLDDENPDPALKFVDSVLWAFKSATKVRWVTTDPDAAEVVFADSSIDAQLLAAWQQARKLVVVLLRGPETVRDAAYSLPYPFSVRQLLSLLEGLGEELDKRAGTEPSVAGNTVLESQETPWSFAEALRALAAENDAQRWFVGAAPGGSRFWVRGDARRHVASRAVIDGIRSGDLPLAQVTLVRADSPPSDGEIRPGLELEWFANYHACAEPAPWLKAACAYRLTRWPDFGALRPADPALLTAQLRIVAALAHAPACAPDAAAQAGAAPDVAIRMFNALLACGCVEPARAAAPAAAPAKRRPVLQAAEIRSFVAAIRRRFGLGGAG
jgi:hypothetical protein